VSQFIDELKRRNVVRAGAAYLVFAWLGVQIADILLDAFAAPDWAMRAVAFGLMLGFPVTLVLAWIYEITVEGVKRTEEVLPGESITDRTGRKLDFVIIGVLAVAVFVFSIDKFYVSANSVALSNESVEINSTLGDMQRTWRTVAVIPFVDLSPSQDQGWLGETIAIELQTELSKRSDLQILSRSSSFDIPENARSSQAIGHSLGVDMLVEGTVRRMGDYVRVTAQLVSVADGYQLWSDVYESRVTADFSSEVAVADFLSREVRAQLAAPFGPTEQNVRFAQVPDSTFVDLLASSLNEDKNPQNKSSRYEGKPDEE